MEYACDLTGKPLTVDCEVCDGNLIRHVGYSENNACIREYYSEETVKTISAKVTELTLGVDPQNRPIVVPHKTICNVMDEIYQSFRPATGDIYGRYNIPTDEPQNLVQSLINQVINIIVTDIKVNLETEQNNAKLSIWTTVLGDGVNDNGLRAHAPIKVRNKRPQPMQFNLNY